MLSGIPPEYYEGHDAYWRDDDKGGTTENPYPKGTEQHFQWESGYDDARMEQ